MSCPFRAVLPGLVVLLTVGVAASAPPAQPKPESTWDEIAREQELTEAQVKLLREQKFFVSDTSMKQIFSAYLGGRVPVFITSDSILNGYHVLFEESIYRLEQANAKKLPAVLDRTLMKNLDRAASNFKGDADLIAAAKKRAAIFLGVARNLLDEKVLPDEVALRTTVQDEVKRVVAATQTHKPAWLGPPGATFVTIDYSRFKPRGFYTRSATLQRHFRAVAWLQAIPFRLEQDEELASFVLMHQAYFDADKEARPDGSLWRAYRAFLGDRDDWDLSNAWIIPTELTRDGLGKNREGYRAQAERDGGPRINDQLRFAPTEPGGKPELAFRFLAAYRLPDGVMFHRTMNAEIVDRKFPTGLEVAAVLGSPFAKERLAKESQKLAKVVEDSRPLFDGKNLYAEYLRCLGVLLERTEPDAPAFMRSEAWKAKTCQTALAGWAQMRHTWALQAKQDVMYMSAFRDNAGFVEPVPEFYGRLAKLIDDTREALDDAGALSDATGGEKELAESFKQALRIVKTAREKKQGLASLTIEEFDLLSLFCPELNGREELLKKGRESLKAFEEVEPFFDLCERLLGPDDAGIQQLAGIVGWNQQPLATNWGRLSKLCHKLEVLAHKQLRQVPFNEEENRFLKGYGKALAGVMFYGGNSYVSPRDDAMRVADVFSNPTAGGHLHVGISRPRAIWVLYPTKDGEVLCRGAVIPYAEFTYPNRLTDSEWKSLLGSPKRPEPPAWAKPVIPPERPLVK